MRDGPDRGVATLQVADDGLQRRRHLLQQSDLDHAVVEDRRACVSVACRRPEDLDDHALDQLGGVRLGAGRLRRQ
jgi:hypothetical protein